MGKEIVFDYSKTAGFISEEEMKNMKSIDTGSINFSMDSFPT